MNEGIAAVSEKTDGKFQRGESREGGWVPAYPWDFWLHTGHEEPSHRLEVQSLLVF